MGAGSAPGPGLGLEHQPAAPGGRAAAALGGLPPGLPPTAVAFPRMDGAAGILTFFLDCTRTVELMKTIHDLEFSYIKQHFNEKLNV